VKSLLIPGIVLVVIGMAAAFGPQTYRTIATGFPANGIPWLMTSGFVVAALGAIMIGVGIGRSRKRKVAARKASETRAEAQVTGGQDSSHDQSDQPWYLK
jgi:hypothetical protein